MKKINYLSILMGIFMLALPAMTMADEYKKTYSESYSVNKDALLYMNNKFGDLHIQNWDKNEVSIDVTVTVEASNEEKASRMLDRIRIEISGDRDRVEAITTIEESSNKNVEFHIDYKVMIPASLQASIINKFGEIYVEEINGKAVIELAYGELEAASLNHSQSFVDLKFSEGDIGYYGGEKLSVSYSELDIEGAADLNLVSRFSEVSVGKLEKLDLDSQYDEISIEKTGDLILVSRFSEITVEKLDGNFRFDVQYGELDVDMVSGLRGDCRIENAFADVTLGLAPSVSFELDAESKFGSVDYPKDASDVVKEEKGFTTNVYNGKVGKGSPDGRLEVKCRNADVKISY